MATKKRPSGLCILRGTVSLLLFGSCSFLFELCQCFSHILIFIVNIVGIHQVDLTFFVQSQSHSCQSTSIQCLDILFFFTFNIQYMIASTCRISPLLEFDITPFVETRRAFDKYSKQVASEMNADDSAWSNEDDSSASGTVDSTVKLKKGPPGARHRGGRGSFTPAPATPAAGSHSAGVRLPPQTGARFQSPSHARSPATSKQ